MSYNIGDFIIRIKNASMAKRKTVTLKYSKVNKVLADILVDERFLNSVKEEEKDGRKTLLASIRYQKRKPVLTDVLLVSKPSLRVHKKNKSVEKRGLGILVISTSKGIMTSDQAKKIGIGGEVLFRVS